MNAIAGGPPRPLRYLSLFSGIEAATVAWHSLGLQPAAFSEIDPFASAVLAHRFPHIPNLGDVTKITEEQVKVLGPLDIIVFGSPCQDLSIAGQRKGFSGERSGLFHTAIRIIQWARKHCGLRFALWENVYGAFSSNQGRDFAAVVAEMAGLRDVAVPANGWGNEGAALGEHGLLEWGTLDAQWFGVAQRRRRVFAVADFGDWADRAPILLERQSLRGDTPPSRTPGQSVTHPVAPCLTSSGRGVERGGDTRGQDPVVAVITPPVQQSVERPRGDGGDPLVLCMAHGQGGAEIASERRTTLTCNHEAPIVVHGTQDPCVSRDAAFTLGRNNGQENVLAFSCKDYGADTDPMFTLQAGAQHGIAYAFQPRIARNGRGDMGDVVSALTAQAGETGKGDAAPCVAVCVTGEVTHTLKAEGFDGSEDGTGRGQPIMAFQPGNLSRGAGSAPSTEVFPTLKADHGRGASDQDPHVMQHMAVRRLTPTECARLQGFPDQWARIPWRGKPAEQCPDGPQYKAYGNSMATPVMAWIGKRLVEIAGVTG